MGCLSVACSPARMPKATNTLFGSALRRAAKSVVKKLLFTACIRYSLSDHLADPGHRCPVQVCRPRKTHFKEFVIALMGSLCARWPAVLMKTRGREKLERVTTLPRGECPSSFRAVKWPANRQSGTRVDFDAKWIPFACRKLWPLFSSLFTLAFHF